MELRRPNGRLQACDPCRLRKVACDHTLPVCRRCLKRKQEAQCVYLMGDAGSKRSDHGNRRRANRGSRTSESLSASGTSSHQPTPDDTSPLPSTTAFGYLGATSYSCVFEDTTRELDPVHAASVPCIGLSTSQGTSRVLSIPAPQKEMCLAVLRKLPFFGPTGRRQEVMNCDDSEWLRQVALSVLDSFDTIYKHYLTDLADDNRLMDLAGLISHNTTLPFNHYERDPERWMGQFLGRNLRWEAVGVLFTFLEFETDFVQRRLSVRSSSSRTCLQHCITLSQYLSEGNDILLYLCSRRIITESVALGDASLSCWRSLGEAITLLTFLGVHDQQDGEVYRPCLSSEFRRRMFARLYQIDKMLVSFTGRPPMLNTRFTSTPLPLDLSDEVLMSDEETISQAVAALDKGWDGKGDLRKVSFIRARAYMAFVHADILECALGTGEKYTDDYILILKKRAVDAFDSLPASVKYNPQDLTDRSVSSTIIHRRLTTQLEHLQSIFFVERLLSKRGRPDDGQLLRTSFAMVTHTLIFWTQQERLTSYCPQIEWLVMAYAAPASGVLCLELLRPSFQGTHPLDRRISRSSIIQNLSLLVGCLDQVQPDAPNGMLCVNCKRIIQKILDYRLNSDPQMGTSMDSFDWGLPNLVEFDFELLDTFDWMQQDIIPQRLP
ncbi:hypothetical protein B0I35DRAFT_445758 [Stachybotrys elegans]|uniref:Zn(2)-C6 fungal-type domain-containing protein n=1 Tax=Stachybotrys elegans TaxID=80388 RepID=A0A8K0WJJ0_9HYPO|nr:hypothetical protein B0I35DRAFT_445758 [Stachybotrys elegans]